MIAIGVRPKRLRHEGVARHLAHGVEHLRIDLLDAGLGARHQGLELDDAHHLAARGGIVVLGRDTLASGRQKQHGETSRDETSKQPHGRLQSGCGRLGSPPRGRRRLPG
jgi:hypothetical protein